MKRALIIGGVLAVGLVVFVLAIGRRDFDPESSVTPAAGNPPFTAAASQAMSKAHADSLYGRVTTDDGETFEGRLRLAGAEEAFWSDYFNGAKDGNPWADHVPPERLEERHPFKILGFETGLGDRRIRLDRPFMVRFGDIVRVEAGGADLRVSLKSGRVVRLDRFGADDFADGLRIWEKNGRVVDLEEWRIDAIDFFPVPDPHAGTDRLHGTVTTRQGDFTGSIQWNREKGVGTDTLDGDTADGPSRLRFDSIRSIERDSSDSSLVTLQDGREIVLSGTRDVGKGNRGVYVDDSRYGRVLVSWDAFERADFSPGGSGPSYDDFPPGRPLVGTVTTRDGRRLTGRLVYDLDESETTETLDAPFDGVNYIIPFSLITSIVSVSRDMGDTEHAWVVLHGGEELRLERNGDLADDNAGLLVFVEGRERPEYVPWGDIRQVELDRPAAMSPPSESEPGS